MKNVLRLECKMIALNDNSIEPSACCIVVNDGAMRAVFLVAAIKIHGTIRKTDV